MAIPQLGSILIGQNPSIIEHVSEALERQERQSTHQRLGEILVELGAISRTELQQALAQQWSLPFLASLREDDVNPETVRQFPLDFLKKHHLVPLEAAEGAARRIAIEDPLDVLAFDTVANHFPEPCVRVVCPAAAVEDALSRCYYQEEASTTAILNELEVSDVSHLDHTSQVEDLLDVASRPPIVRLVNSIFFQAIARRASDIHIEPYEKELKVRFRVDGVLQDWFHAPVQYASALISRLKVMAHLNIAERRLPQDGRSRIRLRNQEIDIRMSTVPTVAGERVVLRILDRSTAQLGLEQLGVAPKSITAIRQLLDLTHGIILLTGPTGSGKTTTLYSVLSELNTPGRNILTVEDPIEYDLPGVGQMQVQPKIGLSFAGALRHMLRQDPDVIMVGEIRDGETAEIAIQAALTGHLVLSTLHTNDSPSAVTRLIDMGIEPFLVSSSLMASIAQRLVRLVCSGCGRKTLAGRDEASLFVDSDIELPIGTLMPTVSGCLDCTGTGYRGRTAIGEILLIDEDIRRLIGERASADELKINAIAKGMQTLRQDGLRRVLAGHTTIEEVLRVTQEDVLRYAE